MVLAIRSLFASLIVLLIAGPASASGGIRAGQGQWTNVVALPSGASVRVLDDAGGTLNGEFTAATDEKIIVAVGTDRFEVAKERVQRVELRVGGGVGRGAKRGFLIGAAAGALVGFATVKSNRGAWIPFLALGWGGVGAAVGALDGRSNWRYSLVYQRSEAEQPEQVEHLMK